MKRVICPSCGAPLPVGVEGNVVTCGHCGSAFERKSLPKPTSAAPMLPVALGLVFGVGLAVSLVIAVVANPTPPPPPPVVITPAVPVVQRAPKVAPPPPQEKVYPLTALAGGAPTGAWFLLDAPGRVGAADTFPLQANLDWMLGVVRRWAVDARLDRLSIDHVSPEGKVDLSADGNGVIDARYASPALRDNVARALEVTQAPVFSELRLAVSDQRVKAMIGEPFGRSATDAVPPAPTLGCDLPEVVAAFRAAGVSQRPEYSLLLQWVESSGRKGYWRWTIGSMKAGDRLESVYLDPATCKKR